jgi:chaperonin GroEL (HSP60 family)
MLGNGVDLEVQIKSIDARTPAGIKVVSKALEAPTRQIAENSGVEGRRVAPTGESMPIDSLI